MRGCFYVRKREQTERSRKDRGGDRIGIDDMLSAVGCRSRTAPKGEYSRGYLESAAGRNSLDRINRRIPDRVTRLKKVAEGICRYPGICLCVDDPFMQMDQGQRRSGSCSFASAVRMRGHPAGAPCGDETPWETEEVITPGKAILQCVIRTQVYIITAKISKI